METMQSKRKVEGVAQLKRSIVKTYNNQARKRGLPTLFQYIDQRIRELAGS